MGLKCGIVGLPNVGKSTLFNALTHASIAAENYPFCTIEPNHGIVEVSDKRLHLLAEIVHPQKIVPVTVEFVDIAGLVAGASKGEGLGNQFLANIRETDAIVHIVRCFDDENVTHVAGKIDPIDDIQVIETELCLADLATVEKYLQRLTKASKAGLDKQAAQQLPILQKCLDCLDQGKGINSLQLAEKDLHIIAPLFLITAKPLMFIANVAENGFTHNPLLDKLVAYSRERSIPIEIVCAKLESEIHNLTDEEKQLFLADTGQLETGLDRITKTAYSLLGLQTFFTAGPKEVKAWTVRKGSSAPQAAGVIHTDFEKGFIRAQTIAFNDYIACRGEQGAKDAGKLRTEGKDYLVCDGDVMHFLFNV
ncbi:MAG: redox-regulated ATPase YchF [Gammaproteobacteria bacterium]|nr:redox-regulated ATPase YchF [Gammaproteobacteria bacterium]